MKVLLAENTTSYNNATQEYASKASRLQAAVDAYKALGIATVPTSTDLPDLWTNPKVFLERMLTGGQPVTLNGGLGSLAVEPGKVYDLLAKPVGADKFLATVQALREPVSNWVGPGVNPSDYELNNGQVQVKQAELDRVRESNRYYATSQRQKDVWDALQTITGSLEAIRQVKGFGAEFDTLEFLKKALMNQGIANDRNPLKASASYIVSAENLRD